MASAAGLLAEARAAAALDHRAIDRVRNRRDRRSRAIPGDGLLRRGNARGAPGARSADRRGDEIAGEVADGLAAAHARGITHCDLAPASIFLTGSGAVKLLDFGIARVAGVRPACVAVPQGTFGYMSPEQRRGENVDPRTDVWAFGIVLHEMLTERPARAPVASELRAVLPQSRVHAPDVARRWRPAWLGSSSAH